jgi:hypothetical protein
MNTASFFLTIIGLIYGLITTFSISNAWEKFSKIRDAIAEENNALESIIIFAKNLEDKKTFLEIRNNILDYCKTVPQIEWKDYWHSKTTHAKFRKISETIASIGIKTEKEAQLFQAISGELNEAASARRVQLVLSQVKITKIQWSLILFLSFILTGGLAVLSIPNVVFSALITGFMIASVLLVLLVLYELDSLKIAEEEVSIAPYKELENYIEESTEEK